LQDKHCHFFSIFIFTFNSKLEIKGENRQPKKKNEGLLK